MHHLIKEEYARLGRPLRVCEIGVDRGQMRRYMQDAGFTGIACWEAVDYKLQPELMESSYTKQIQANVDLPDFSLAEKYDVIIVLHLLEHLFEPEQLVARLNPALVLEWRFDRWLSGSTAIDRSIPAKKAPSDGQGF